MEELTLTEKVIILATGLLLWGGHHFPWRIIPGFADENGDLKLLLRYVYGVGCILIGLAAWCAHLGDWSWFWRVAALCVSAGFFTVLPRLTTREAERQAMEKGRDDYEQALKD